MENGKEIEIERKKTKAGTGQGSTAGKQWRSDDILCSRRDRLLDVTLRLLWNVTRNHMRPF